ncbi:hypothetical protein B0H14DRAFT_2710025, partial [Mycena olivaceomarginata]
GGTSPIYALKSTSPRDATCWIPSQEGKKFSVNWSNRFRDRPHALYCSIHGNHPDDADAIGISYATTSDFTRRDFVFSAIQVTDDDAYLYTLDNPPAFGTIRLELWEADIEQIVQSPYQHRYGGQVLEGQIIHETSKKGRRAPTFGGEYVVPQATVNMVNGTRKGAAPLATFTFNYRPFDILLDGGIIPRRTDPSQPRITVKPEAAQLESLRAQKAGDTPRPKLKTHWRNDPRTGKTVQVIEPSLIFVPIVT